jgi:AcrR family transcriptional regulator
VADPIERLRRIGLAYVDFALAHPNHYRLMFMTPHPPIEPDPALVEQGNPEQDAYAFLKVTVADAIAQGRMKPGYEDVETTAQIAWAGVHGLVSLHIAKANDAWVDWRPAPATARLLIDAMLHGFARS